MYWQGLPPTPDSSRPHPPQRQKVPVPYLGNVHPTALSSSSRTGDLHHTHQSAQVTPVQIKQELLWSQKNKAEEIKQKTLALQELGKLNYHRSYTAHKSRPGPPH